MKKTILLTLLSCLSIASAQTENTQISTDTPSATIVTDIPASHWARDAVALVLQKGLMAPYPDQSFRGDQPLTRYEAAGILAKTLASGALQSSYASFTISEKETLAQALNELANQIATINVRQTDTAQQVGDLNARLSTLEHVTEQMVTVGASQSDVSAATATLKTQLEEEMQNLANQREVDDLKTRVATLEAAQQQATPASTLPKPGDLPEATFHPDPPAHFGVSFGIEKRANVETLAYNASATLRQIGLLELQATATYAPSNTLGIQLNALRSWNNHNQLSPYVGLGAGLLRSPSFNDATVNSNDTFGSLITGVNYNFTDTMLFYVEADTRYYFSNSGTGTGLTASQTGGINAGIRAGIRLNFQ